MFCPTCGSNNADTNAFCNVCGTPLTNNTNYEETVQVVTQEYAQPVYSQPAYTQPEYAQPEYAQPEYAQPVYSQPMYATPVKKKEYLKNIAPKGTKTAATISLLLTLVLMVTMFLSYFVILNVQADSIPVVGLAFKIEDEDFSDITDELDEQIDYAQDTYEDTKDDYSSKEQKAIEKVLKAGEKCADCFSIGNVERFIKTYEDVSEDFFEENMDIDEFNEIKEIFTAIKVAIIIAIIFCLIFSLLGGFCKSIVLVVFGMIFSAIYSFILCPIVLSLVILALHIALIVYLAKVNGAYKSYKRNPVM